MRRLLGLLVILAPAVGHAQPGATEPIVPGSAPVAPPMNPGMGSAPPPMLTDPAVLSRARGARAAAVRGDCVGARILGGQIARMDPEFHRTVIRTDPVITSCRPAPRQKTIAAQESEGQMQPRAGTPPLSGGQLVGQFIIGGLFTLGGAVGGAYLGSRTENDCSDECFGGIILGGLLGGTVMAAVGVNLVGDTDDVEGSLGLAIAGSMITTLVSVGIMAKADFDDETVPVLLLMSAPAAGAMIGFNLSRKYKDVRVSVRPTPTPMGQGGIGLSLASGTF